MHIHALATCYNRKEKTLRAIQDLKVQHLPDDTTLSITIVDDGSTDGTATAVKSIYPDVEIIQGDGGLFWAGGMRYGWEQSVKKKQFDALLVFNDDISLYHNAIQQLLDTYKYAKQNIDNNLYAITGAFSSKDKSEITYGGFHHASSWHTLRFKKVAPNGTPQKVDTINMNMVLISREALNKIGFLSSFFQHGGADMDFGLRLKKAGGTLFLTADTIGICEKNSLIGTSLEPGIGYIERIRRLTSIKEQPPAQRFRYFRRHGGPFWFFLFLMPYLRAVFGGRV